MNTPKPSHTPAPWTAHWGQIQDKHGIRIYALESKEFRLRPLAEVSFVGDSFSHANANLISASPELLGVVKRMMESTAECLRGNCGECWRCLARVALAKAEPV